MKEVKMTEKPDLKIVTPKIVPADALDMNDLWLDPALGDGITDTHWHSIPVDKPKDFFRVHPDPAYRRRTEVYTHKPEGAIEEQHYVLHRNMRGRILEARPATIVTCIYRDGSPRLWVLKFPKSGERDNEAWTSARQAAREAMTKWIKLVWVRRAYQIREARPGYAPEPDLSKLPPFDDLVTLGLGAHGIIYDINHPIYRDLMGDAPKSAGDDGSNL
jgi:hypothetical protein